MKEKKFVDIEASADRTDYANVLRKIDADGVCPFCPKHFTYHTKPILLEKKYWLLTENMAPYTGTKHHFLLLHKKHIEHISEISPKAWLELLAVLKWTNKKFDLPAGTFFMRFGDGRYTGASVTQHLHAQLLLGTKRTKKTYPIAPPLGYSTKPYTPGK